MFPILTNNILVLCYYYYYRPPRNGTNFRTEVFSKTPAREIVKYVDETVPYCCTCMYQHVHTIAGGLTKNQ